MTRALEYYAGYYVIVNGHNRYLDRLNLSDKNLVLCMQFPRKVYKDGTPGTFAEANFSHKQEALFVERL